MHNQCKSARYYCHQAACSGNALMLLLLVSVDDMDRKAQVANHVTASVLLRHVTCDLPPSIHPCHMSQVHSTHCNAPNTEMCSVNSFNLARSLWYELAARTAYFPSSLPPPSRLNKWKVRRHAHTGTPRMLLECMLQILTTTALYVAQSAAAAVQKAFELYVYVRSLMHGIAWSSLR